MAATDEEMAEYRKRLVPASDAEIIGLAERIWAEPVLRAIFERVGYHGDLTEAEEARVQAAIDAYRQGSLWDRDELHLWLAPCLVRQLAAGLIERFDCPAAKAFLADRRVVRAGAFIKPVSPTAKEVMAFAHAMQNDPEAWAMFMRLRDHRDRFVKDIDREGVIARFEARYCYKYGLLNRDPAGLGSAVALLRSVAAGDDSLDSPDAWAFLRRENFIRD